MSEIPRVLSVQWLRQQYLNKTLTPQEVIEAIIKRAQADQGFNIWIKPPDYSGIKPYLDGLKALDIENTPLWGIPFAIKDNIDLAGAATTAGCPEYAYHPEDSATVVQRLTAVGAIPIGKTNLDQFATGRGIL